MSKFYNKKPAIGPRVFGYSDQYSVRNDSINDLKISHIHNTVGKSSKRLARIGDPALIAAKKNDEYVVFAAKIGEWVEDSRINLWYDRGGNKWDVNYEISDKTEPITLSKKEIIEITGIEENKCWRIFEDRFGTGDINSQLVSLEQQRQRLFDFLRKNA